MIRANELRQRWDTDEARAHAMCAGQAWWVCGIKFYGRRQIDISSAIVLAKDVLWETTDN